MNTRRTIYLLHGHLCDARVWEHQRSALCADFDVRVPRLRGLDSLEAMAAHVLDGAPERFAVAGHSMGGRVALEIMRLAGHRVSKLALLDSGAHAARGGEADKRQELVDFARHQGMGELARLWATPMVHPDRVGDTPLMETIFDMVESYSQAEFERQVAALLGRRDAFPLLETIQCDTLVLCGREDSWSPVAQHEEIAARIARATLTIIEDCGHMAPMERPEAVTRSLLEWLAR